MVKKVFSLTDALLESEMALTKRNGTFLDEWKCIFDFPSFRHRIQWLLVSVMPRLPVVISPHTNDGSLYHV